MPFLVLFLTILICCENKWNSDFANGEINKENIKKELPIGSNYKQLIAYIKKNNIPKYKKSDFGYSEKIDSYKDIEDFDIALKNRFNYAIRIDGHKSYPYYYHPILYFCYDKSNILIYIGQFGYP